MPTVGKNNTLFFNSFALRIIALASVLSDHIALMFLSSSSVLYFIMRTFGRLAFVFFAFFVSEGILYSKNKDKYLLRFSLLYVILQVFIVVANLVDKSFVFRNIFFTLGAMASLLVYLEKKEWKKVYYLIPAVLLLVINVLADIVVIPSLEIFAGDYGLYGMGLILAFYGARKLGTYLLLRYPTESEGEEESNKHRQQIIYNSAASLALVSVSMISFLLSTFGITSFGGGFQSFSLIAIPFIMLYSGKLGHNSKGWRAFYYSFFPLHIILIFVISLII